MSGRRRSAVTSVDAEPFSFPSEVRMPAVRVPAVRMPAVYIWWMFYFGPPQATGSGAQPRRPRRGGAPPGGSGGGGAAPPGPNFDSARLSDGLREERGVWEVRWTRGEGRAA